MIEFNGECKSLTEWANGLGIDRSTLRNRISNGWPLEEALTRKNFNHRTRKSKEAADRRKKSIDLSLRYRRNARNAMNVLRHMFPDDGYGRLWLAVLNEAVLGLYGNDDTKRESQAWLSGDMEAMQMIGVDPDYIRLVLTQAGVMNFKAVA